MKPWSLGKINNTCAWFFLWTGGLYLGEKGRIIWVFQLPLEYLVLFEYELSDRGKKLSFKFISLIKLFEGQTSKTLFADVKVVTYTNTKAWCPVNLLFWEGEITCTVLSLAILNNCSFISKKFVSLRQIGCFHFAVTFLAKHRTSLKSFCTVLYKAALSCLVSIFVAEIIFQE